jgi:hypothetical protein
LRNLRLESSFSHLLRILLSFFLSFFFFFFFKWSKVSGGGYPKRRGKRDGAYVRKRNKSDRSGRRQVLVRV